MSSSRQFTDGQRQGKAPEKSNFVQTCNLLSQYMKEKGSLKDLNLEIGGKVENLETLVKSGLSQSASAPTAIDREKDKGKSCQPSSEQQPSSAPDLSITAVEDSSHKPTSKDSAGSDSKTAQLTIFYSGRVFVFDDYPSDKTKDLVAVARKGSSQMSYGILSNTLREKTSPGAAAASASSPRDGPPPRPQPAASLKAVGVSSNTCKEKTDATASGAAPSCSEAEARVPPRAEANGSDLPIARRSSINRFLEKRKDRAAARGPYQVQEQAASSSKADEHLELKL